MGYIIIYLFFYTILLSNLNDCILDHELRVIEINMLIRVSY